MRRRRMGAISLGDPSRLNLQTSKVDHHQHHHGIVVEEIEGLIRVYKDGNVDRFPVVPDAPCSWSPEAGVTSKDVVIDKTTSVWARFYVPMTQGKLPLLVYFHGGGFCVGSAAWSVYHDFLERLSSRAGCIVMSVNYRLAPENRLPAAYDDAFNAMKWVRQQASRGGGAEELSWWWSHCNFSRVFIGGDSAGASITYNAAARVGSSSEMSIRGVILIQPFFGGEARTASERNMVQPSSSALSLAAADSYWRLALPVGANRDHQWCNPMGSTRLEELRLAPLLVCIAEMDILRDRDLEFCRALKRAGKSVEHVMHAGVGHAFQVLSNSRTSQARTQEMISQIKAFLNNR